MTGCRAPEDRLILAPSVFSHPRVPADFFDDPYPVHLDLGCGIGFFLCERSGMLPGVNFIGLDAKVERVARAARRCFLAGRGNVRLMTGWAEELLSTAFVAGAFEAVYVNYPDPWPKRRHHKNRMIQTATVPTIAGLLQPGGRLYFTTDHGEYAAWAVARIAGSGLFGTAGGIAPWPDDYPRTHFSRMMEKDGARPIFSSFTRLSCR